jgi:hypothetical protein
MKILKKISALSVLSFFLVSCSSMQPVDFKARQGFDGHGGNSKMFRVEFK